MAISSAYWLVAGRRNGLAMIAGPRTAVQGARDVDVLGSYLVLNYWRPNTPFISLVASVPLIYHRPLSAGPKSHVCPQEEKSARCCRFESHNDSEIIARNSAFYRANKLSIGQLHTT